MTGEDRTIKRHQETAPAAGAETAIKMDGNGKGTKMVWNPRASRFSAEKARANVMPVDDDLEMQV
jgi:hypothetical protein